MSALTQILKAFSINGLSSGTTPLGGTEEVPIWQSSSTVKVTVQDIADLAGGDNLGNADLTSSAATRKFILNGDLSTDYLTIRDGSDTTDILKVQGDDVVRMNSLGIGQAPSASYPISFLTGSATGTMYVASTVASGTCMYVLSTGSSSDTLRIHNTGTTQTKGIEFQMSANASGSKTGIDLPISGTAINNIGINLNVSGGTNNYAIDFVAGDLKFATGTGSKIGTATSEKIGFWNTTPITQPAAMTAQLTDITGDITPATPDYVVTATSSGWGFGSQDEFETAMNVINNLQTRVQELEDALSTAAGGVGLLA